MTAGWVETICAVGVHGRHSQCQWHIDLDIRQHGMEATGLIPFIPLAGPGATALESMPGRLAPH